MIYQAKRERAIATLGIRWVLHRENHVQRLKQSDMNDLHKTDLWPKFAKMLKAMEKEAQT